MWIADLVGEPCRAEGCGSMTRIPTGLFAFALAAAMAAADGGTQVTVVGGADASGHQYSWTVTNGRESPIVRVEFPHYRAGLFRVPHGWSADESTYLVNVGVKDRPGVCIGRATSPADAIAMGKSATFGMQIAAPLAQRGRGRVFVSFADDTSVGVSGVELPQRASFGDRYLTLIGLGVIFALTVAVQVYRTRRRRSSPGSTGEA